jgi:hypothetical protein
MTTMYEKIMKKHRVYLDNLKDNHVHTYDINTSVENSEYEALIKAEVEFLRDLKLLATNYNIK